MILKINFQCFLLNFSSATGYRVKRRTTGPLVPFDWGTVTVNADSWPLQAPPAPSGYQFAFWSNTDQDTLSTQQTADIHGPTQPNWLPYHLGGAWNVSANAYYIPQFGGGVVGSDKFVWIDAFDIQLGDFIPDNFVDVTPDPTGTLTVEGNNGYIDTTTEITAGDSITITARDKLPGKQFGYWLQLYLSSSNTLIPATVGHPDIHDVVAHKNDLVVAFSFYNEVPAQPRLNINVWDELVVLALRLKQIQPEPPGPQWAREVDSALTLGAASQSVAPKLRNKVLGIALEQLQLGAETLGKQLNLGEE